MIYLLQSVDALNVNKQEDDMVFLSHCYKST